MDIVVVGYDGNMSLMIKPESIISLSSDMNPQTGDYVFLLLLEKNDIYLSKLRGAHKYYDNEVPDHPVLIDLVEISELMGKEFILVHGYQTAPSLV